MTRPKTPLPFAYFATRRPSPGRAAMSLELGDLRILVEGLDEDLAGRLVDRFAPFSGPVEPAAAPPQAAAGPGVCTLSVRLGTEER